MVQHGRADASKATESGACRQTPGRPTGARNGMSHTARNHQAKWSGPYQRPRYTAVDLAHARAQRDATQGIEREAWEAVVRMLERRLGS
jgi:hypothetical protein